MQQPSEHSYRTITIDSNVPNQPSSTSSALYIPSLEHTHSMDFVVLPNFERLQSENKERVLNSLKEKINKELSAIEQEVCIEDICFEEGRVKVDQRQHEHHKTIKLSELLKQLEILKCNYHFTVGEPQQVIHLLDSLDDVYNEITRFQVEIMRLFNKIKTEALRHITEVKQSFETKHYDDIKSRLLHQFDYANTKYALAEMEKFKKIDYPNLEYPNFKVGNMKTRIAKANVNNKVIAVQAINGWIERLYALEKKDSKVIVNRAVPTFMNLSPCEQILFSYYLKSEEYQVQEAKRLRRVDFAHNTLPFAAIQKELLPQTTIKLKVTHIAQHGGIFLGVTPLSVLQKQGEENLISHQGSYYLTNRGHMLSCKSISNSCSLPFSTKDEVWIRRDKNTIVWKRRKEGGQEQEVRVTLGVKEYSEHFYVCVHLEDRESSVQIID